MSFTERLEEANSSIFEDVSIKIQCLKEDPREKMWQCAFEGWTKVERLLNQITSDLCYRGEYGIVKNTTRDLVLAIIVAYDLTLRDEEKKKHGK